MGRTCRIGSRQQKNHLFSTPPESGISSAELVAENLCNLPQRGVTGIVSPPIIECLEVVDVDESETHRYVAALCARKLNLHFLIEQRSVSETGEPVAA